MKGIVCTKLVPEAYVVASNTFFIYSSFKALRLRTANFFRNL